MICNIKIEDFLNLKTPLIDVRSPGEFNKGHIPGAVNIPLFSDDERAHIGTLYVNESQEKAIEMGFQYVNPKLNDFLIQSRKIAPDGNVAVYCWRGGLRSNSFARHLSENGFGIISVIEGGYKAYRKYLTSIFDIKFDIKIIGGYTGSGKTPVLLQLKKMGFQAIDLEGLAKHKGSAFGAFENEIQPTTEQFENDLFDQWRKLDYNKPIWLEDESINIGGVNIPANLFRQMRISPVYFIDIPCEERAIYLVKEYAGVKKELLEESIQRISKRMGGQETKNALKLLNEDKFYELAMLTLIYYDRAYLKGLRFHDEEKIFKIKQSKIVAAINAESIKKLYEQQ